MRNGEVEPKDKQAGANVSLIQKGDKTAHEDVREEDKPVHDKIIEEKMASTKCRSVLGF